MIACWLKAFTAFAPVSVTIAYYPLFYLDFTVFYPKSVRTEKSEKAGWSTRGLVLCVRWRGLLARDISVATLWRDRSRRDHECALSID
jgi:hypothetical protein